MTTNLEPVQTFKILIVGDSGVGKSSLMNRFVHDVFNVHYTATIGVDFQVAILNIGDYRCRLQIWDTAGQERFRSITSSYYRGADGIIIVYDVTNSASFSNVKVRVADIGNYCDGTVPKLLVGNKDDDDRQLPKVVDSSVAREYAKNNQLPFFETSVKDNKNISETFQELTERVLRRRLDQAETIRKATDITRIEQAQSIENDPKRKCCTT